MLPEISLNILDVAQNSISAGAALTEISVVIDTASDSLTVVIKDNGCGMNEEQLKAVTDPFYTTRKTRKVGLGVPFFKMAAEITGGSFEISSAVGKGTTVKAVFGLSHTVGMAFRFPWDTISIQQCVHDTDFPAGMSSVFPDHPDIPAGDEDPSADTDSCDSSKTGG